MNQISAIEEKQIHDNAKTFSRRFTGNFIRNLFTRVLLWGFVFVVTALVHSKVIFSSGSMPQAFRTIGTVRVLGVYLAARLVAGLYSGTLAGSTCHCYRNQVDRVRWISDDG